MRQINLLSTQTHGKVWNRFTAWCESRGYGDMPATSSALRDYVLHLSKQGKAIGNIQQILAVIARTHILSGHISLTGSIPVQAALRECRWRNASTNPRSSERIKVLCN